MKHGVLGQAVYAAAAAVFGVDEGVYNPFYAAQRDCAGAHGARLQRHIQGGVFETVFVTLLNAYHAVIAGKLEGMVEIHEGDAVVPKVIGGKGRIIHPFPVGRYKYSDDYR